MKYFARSIFDRLSLIKNRFLTACSNRNRLTGPQINWQNFTASQIAKWSGQATVYSGQLAFRENFKSERNLYYGTKEVYYSPPQLYPLIFAPLFYLDEDRSSVLFDEYMHFASKTAGHFWSINYCQNSFADGLVHPRWNDRHGFFLANGGSAWCSLYIPPYAEGSRKEFGLEMSICHSGLKISVELTFCLLGELVELVYLQESNLGSRNGLWSGEREVDIEFEPDGQKLPFGTFVGQKQVVTDLLDFYEHPCLVRPLADWQHEAKYKIIALPDGVRIRLPINMSLPEERDVQILWQVPDGKQTLCHLAVRYDEEGKLIAFESAVLERETLLA